MARSRVLMRSSGNSNRADRNADGLSVLGLSLGQHSEQTGTLLTGTHPSLCLDRLNRFGASCSEAVELSQAPSSTGHEDLRFDLGFSTVCFIFTYKKAIPIGEPAATTPVSVNVALTLPG